MRTNLERSPDEDHLRLLSIFYYVMAGISALLGCVPLIYFAIGVAILVGIPGDANPPPPELGMFITIISLLGTLMVWGWAILELMTARALGGHFWYRFCFVWACVELINLPFGTILGVFTIIALSHPGVRALYEGIPYRDPRLAFVDEFDDDDDDDTDAGATAPKTPRTPGSESIQESSPNP